MTGAAKEIALGPFRLNLANTRLLRNGVILESRPQVFRVFKVLIENYGQLVEYQQLIREAWSVHVSRHTVATTVNELKNLLEEHGDWIVCRPKLGYFLEIPESEDLMRRGWHFWSLHTRTGYENALKCFQVPADCARPGREPHHRPRDRRRRLCLQAVRAARAVAAHRQYPQARQAAGGGAGRKRSLRPVRVSSQQRRVAPRRGGDPAHRPRARHAARLDRERR